MTDILDDALIEARAKLLHDLSATVRTTPQIIDTLDEVIQQRRAWVEPWPEGAAYVSCLTAQDLQEALAAVIGRWPVCRVDGTHQLHVEPDLGEDPHWVCEDCATVVTPIGAL